MPAFSYKERFIPLILDGSKCQTIRKRRTHPPKAGDTLYHYFGLRTKHCRKLGESICCEVKTIYIKKNGVIIIFQERLTDRDAELLINGKLNKMGIKLSNHDANILAFDDGFRMDSISRLDKLKCIDLMIRWWKQTHSLPFIGDLIKWEPITFKKAKSASIIKPAATGSGK